MDIHSVILCMFGVISTLYIVHLGFYLTGANFYDIWQFRRAHYTKPKVAPRPLVTVAIPAHNEERVIIRCLESIRQNTYKNVQILVANDCSRDTTAQLVQTYMRQHPEVAIRLTTKRKNVGKGEALNYVLKRYGKGELVMTLDADSVLLPTAIANAVTYFYKPGIVGIAANVQIIEEPTILGILQKFEHMVGYRSKKIYSLSNCEFVIGGVASTYRMDILRKVGFYDTDTLTEDIGLSMKVISHGNRAYRIAYAVDVVAMTEGVDSLRALLKQRYRWKYGSLQNILKYRHLIGHRGKDFSRMLTLYRLPMAVLSELALLFGPLVWGYGLYLTLVQRDLGLILGAYITITTYTFITLWFDEHASRSDRFRLSLYAPVAYFTYYLMDIVQLIAVVRCICRAPRLCAKNRGDTGNTWVSPHRIGRQIIAEEGHAT